MREKAGNNIGENHIRKAMTTWSKYGENVDEGTENMGTKTRRKVVKTGKKAGENAGGNPGKRERKRGENTEENDGITWDHTQNTLSKPR
jgi:hypothetical protein